MTRLRRVAFGLPTHHPIFGPDPHISSLWDDGPAAAAAVPQYHSRAWYWWHV